MWEFLQSMGGHLAVVGILVIVFIGAAIYATRNQDAPPDGPKYPWIRYDDFVAVIRDPNWSWTRNHRCKYVNIRMDTRTRTVVLYDRYGDPITLDELKYQEGRTK